MDICNLKWIFILFCLCIAFAGLYLALLREHKNIKGGTLDPQDGSGSLKDGSFNFKFAIGLVLIFIGVGGGYLSIKNLPGCNSNAYTDNQIKLPNHSVQSIKDQMDTIGTTGWIHMGTFNNEIRKYSEGPYFATYKSSIPSDSSFYGLMKLHKGDIIQTLRERRVYITGYKRLKAKNALLFPPEQLDEDQDYTGVKLPIGIKLKVEDIQSLQDPNLGSEPGSVIWVRVRPEE